MSKPAITQGVYIDCKFMPGLKSARISIDIPIEHSNEFLRMFGAPDRANPVHVAVARLEVGAYAPEGNGPEGDTGCAGAIPVAANDAPMRNRPSEDKPRTYTRSQIAAMKCRDREFQDWLWSRTQAPSTRDLDEFRANREAWCDRALKGRLVIFSKSELDPEGPRARAFDALLTDFDLRNTVR